MVLQKERSTTKNWATKNWKIGKLDDQKLFSHLKKACEQRIHIDEESHWQELSRNLQKLPFELENALERTAKVDLRRA